MSSFYMLAIGDSKTVGYTCCLGTNAYRNELLANMSPAVVAPLDGSYFAGVHAAAGLNTEQAAGGIDAFLASLYADKVPAFALINLGSNDFNGAHIGTITQAAWEANMGYILDAIHAKFPTTQVLLMRPYWQGEDVGMALINDTWMPNVLASRAAWASVGPDERVFLAPAGTRDDATHPNATGYSLTAAEWQTVMGY